MKAGDGDSRWDAAYTLLLASRANPYMMYGLGVCWDSSTAELLFCKQEVPGSNPGPSSKGFRVSGSRKKRNSKPETRNPRPRSERAGTQAAKGARL